METLQTTRTAFITRETSETTIELSLNIDGARSINVRTGYGFADHMITLIAFWAGFDLSLTCTGDLYVDAHHTVEDVALCLGQAINICLGDKKYIARTASAKVPMDEALAEVCLDLSGRAYHVMQGQDLLPPIIAGEENDLWREFFKSLATGSKMNLHVIFHYGRNGHHLLESACKSLGIALKKAVTCNQTALLSTKGRLD